jgi:hypothetical protein
MCEMSQILPCLAEGTPQYMQAIGLSVAEAPRVRDVRTRRIHGRLVSKDVGERLLFTPENTVFPMLALLLRP